MMCASQQAQLDDVTLASCPASFHSSIFLALKHIFLPHSMFQIFECFSPRTVIPNDCLSSISKSHVLFQKWYGLGLEMLGFF